MACLIREAFAKRDTPFDAACLKIYLNLFNQPSLVSLSEGLPIKVRVVRKRQYCGSTWWQCLSRPLLHIQLILVIGTLVENQQLWQTKYNIQMVMLRFRGLCHNETKNSSLSAVIKNYLVHVRLKTQKGSVKNTLNTARLLKNAS